MAQYESRIHLYNRYSGLTEDAMDVDETLPSQHVPFRVTADEINQRSLARAHAHKGERRKAQQSDVEAAERTLRYNSIKFVQSIEQLVRLHTVKCETRAVLRRFYHSHRAVTESLTAEHLTNLSLYTLFPFKSWKINYAHNIKKRS
jgi:hypothetical protein